MAITGRTAAVLNVLVLANTKTATGQLVAFDRQLRKSTASANASSTAMGSKLARGAKTAGVAVGALAAYGLYKAVQVGARFEKQMDALGAVSHATARQMKQLEAQALKLGESTAFTANEVAQAQTELAKGGLTVKQIYGGALKAALSLAAAGELELAEAASTTVNAMKLFGLRGKDAGQVADMLATAANKTTADVSDFAMALKQGGAAAKIAGLDMNQAVTILEALAEAGIKNSDAGTSMKASLIQLLKPTEKQEKLARLLGIQWTTQAGTMKGAAGISKELRQATEGMTKAERAQTLATLAGTDGFRTLAALYSAGPAKLKALTQANEKHGTAQKIAAEKMDNLSGDAEQLTGALETLGIKIHRIVAPALRTAVQAMTGAVQAISKGDFGEVSKRINRIVASLKTFWRESGVTRAVVTEAFRIIRDVIKDVIAAAIQVIRGWVQVIRGIVKVISGLLTGDFGRAWDGVKDIFSGGVKATVGILKGITAPFRRIMATVGGILGDGFKAAWDGVKSLFESNINRVIGFLNLLIDAINIIPGIPDIDHIGTLGGGGGGKKPSGGVTKTGTRSGKGRQRGGSIFGGRPSGDSIPAMLERGEYVLNKNVVKAIGARQLDAINFAMAPRFATGGHIPGGKPSQGGFDPVGAVGSVIGRGASFFIDKLPKPNLPEPFAGLGPYVIGRVVDYIKDGFKSKKLGKLSIAPGAMGAGGVDQALAAAIAIARRHGSDGAVTNRAGAASFHNWAYDPPHKAVDLSGGNMMATAKGILRAFTPSRILELFYNPLGFQVDNYRKGPMTVFDHFDHVHVAFQKGGKVGGLPGWVHGSGTLNADQLATLAHLVGMPNPGLMSQIAQAESRGNPGAMGGAGDKGLWQIIPSTAAAFGINYGSLFDPLANARGAKKILAGQGLTAWSTYNDGSYSGFPKGKVMPVGKAAAERRKKRREHFKFGLQGSVPKGAAPKTHARTPVLLPPLKPSQLGAAAKALPQPVQEMLQSPGLTFARKLEIGQYATQLAERTVSPEDDKAAATYVLGLQRRNKKRIQKQLNKISRQLQQPMSPARRKKLIAHRESLLGALGESTSEIASAKGILRGEGLETEAGEDPLAEAIQRQTEAAEELARVMEEHKQEEEALKNELAQNRAIAESELATSAAVARQLLADIVSEQVGPRSYYAAQTAGSGSVGSSRRF